MEETQKEITLESCEYWLRYLMIRLGNTHESPEILIGQESNFRNLLLEFRERISISNLDEVLKAEVENLALTSFSEEAIDDFFDNCRKMIQLNNRLRKK